MSRNTIISLAVGQKPTFVQGSYSVGNRPMELTTATRMLKDISSSRFSPIAFGEYIYEAAGANDDEIDKALLSALYLINRISEEDTSRGYLAQRIMDTLAVYGYTNVTVPNW